MRFYICVFLAKFIGLVSRIFKIGSGYTWPGHVVLKVYPNVLKDSHIKFEKGVILISGTNGKTTTAKLLTHILNSAGYSVVTNATGGNILNGVVSAILLNTTLTGKVTADAAVLEVDEFALPNVLMQLPPKILVLLNLSRDQLDRYGEVDIILDRWQKAITTLNNCALVYYAGQPQFKRLASSFTGRSLAFTAELENMKSTILRGEFNAKNVNAAVLVSELFAIKKENSVQSLKSFESAYGRGEVILYKRRPIHLFLAKNPASMHHNLLLLHEYNSESTALVFILNDKIPDGRDVSWIYDIHAETLFENGKNFKTIYVSGTRCLDMAVRLAYAGIKIQEQNIIEDISKAVNAAVKNPDVKEVLVLPNYSAMLEIRKALTGKAIL